MVRRLALFLLLAACIAPAKPLPRTVWGVLGPIPITYVQGLTLDGVPLYGMYEPDTRRISLRAGMDPRQARKTLHHELCHAHLSDLGVSVGDEATEDAVCDALALARVLEEDGR